MGRRGGAKEWKKRHREQRDEVGADEGWAEPFGCNDADCEIKRFSPECVLKQPGMLTMNAFGFTPVAWRRGSFKHVHINTWEFCSLGR